jgi:hypothetical protein
MRTRFLLSAATMSIALAVAGCHQPSHKNNAPNAPAMTTGAPAENFREACRQDMRQYCSGQRGPERRQCLELHKSQLSEGCKAFLDSRGNRGSRRRRAL